MIYEHVEFHNVAAIAETGGGVAMQRVPETVRRALNPGAQEQMLRPASGEIRFAATPGQAVEVTLSSTGSLRVSPFFGDFQYASGIDVGPKPVRITLGWNPRLVDHLDEILKHKLRFHPYVVRLLMAGDPVRFHGVTGAGIRPPRAEELPALRYMAYGTSITHGHSASAPHLTYAAQTARHLGVDLLNFGVAGSCHCEPELADYLAGREDWDIASLALSVNMMEFSETEFEKRVRYFVHTVAGADARRPVACVTLFRYFGDLHTRDEVHPTEKVGRFRQIVRDAVADCPTPNAHLVEGPDILADLTGLSPDLIHPADNGMIDMGRNLAAAMQPLLSAP